MTASAYALLRAPAVQLCDRAAALDDRALPEGVQAVLDGRRYDLVVIPPAKESSMGTTCAVLSSRGGVYQREEGAVD